MESIFKLGILLSVVDGVTGPSAQIGQGITALRGKVLSIGPAFNKFKKYGLLVATVAAGLLTMMSNSVMATTGTQKALGELSSVGIQDLAVLEQAGADFSGQWAGTTKAEFISAAYDIKSGIASLTDEGVAEFAKLAAVTGKATKSTTGEMTSLFATGYGIYKDMYGDLTDMQFGEVFSAGISASVKNFKTTGSGMAQAISTLGATATSAKVPLEEQLSVLGMLQATMSGSEAGTKYKAMMNAAAGAGDKLGLKFMDSNKQLLSMPEMLTALQGKYGTTLDSMEKMEIKKAFGTDEAVALIDLMYNKVGDLETNIGNLSEATKQGAAFTEVMAEAMNQDIGAGITLLGQQWHNLVEIIGKQFIPLLAPVFAWLGSLINRFSQFATKHETLTRIVVVGVGVIVALAFVLGSVAAAMGAVGVMAPNVISGFSMVGKAALFMKTGLMSAIASTKTWLLWQKQALLTSLYFHGGVMGLARSLATSFLTSMGAAISAVWSFTASLLANPVTWIVVGVVALGVALYFLYTRFDLVVAAAQKVSYAFGFLLGSAVKMGQGLVEQFKAALPMIKSVGKILMSIAFPPLAIAFYWDDLKVGVSAMISWIKGLVPTFLESGRALWGALTSGIKSMIMAPVEAVKAGLSKVRNLLPFSDAKEGPLSTLTLSGSRMMETIGAGVQGAAPGLMKTVSTAMAGVAAFFGLGGEANVSANVDQPQAVIVQQADVIPPAMQDISGQAAWQAQPVTTPAMSDVSAQAAWQTQPVSTPVMPDVSGQAAWQTQPVTTPAIPDVSGQAAWQTQPITIPDLSDISGKADIATNISQPPINPGFQNQVKEPVSMKLPGVSKLEDRKPDSGGIKKALMSGNESHAAAKKETTINIYGLTLPNVTDGGSFLSILQQLEGAHNA
jgi:TP901 family phage tail tape measure protein